MLFGWKFLPESLSTYSDRMDDLLWLITGLMGVCLVISALILFYLFFAFKRKEGKKAQYIGGDTKKQLAFVYVTLFAFVLIDLVIDVQNHAVWAHVKENLPAAEMRAQATGQQWAWTFNHAGKDGELGTADDIGTVNELHIVAEKLTHVDLQSADVLHSFSVPIFRLKQDVIPGRIITTWFQTKSFDEVKASKELMNSKNGNSDLMGADTEGSASFDIQCAEMCGVGHGIMASKLIIHTADDYNNWVSENSPIVEEAAE